MIKISIIIPVFNCEKTIEKSIQSIQKQTMKEIEIICINDGSSDRSEEVIRKLQSEDKRIILYTQKNQGAGLARNLGIAHATGEFVAFLDADDYYLEADALESMVLACKKYNVDVCGTSVRIIRDGVLGLDRNMQKLHEAAKKSCVLMFQDFQFDYGYYGFIFKRSVICENEIKFPKYRRFQDPVFFVRVMYATCKFCFIDKALYAYQAPNVLLRFQKSNVNDLLCALLDNLHFAAEHNLMKLFTRTLERIEIEYNDIICHNLSTENLACLLEIDTFIKKMTGNEKDVIKPLQNILESVKTLENVSMEKWLNRLQQCERIFPYGAGKTCDDFLSYLKQMGCFNKVSNILVTDMSDNPAKLQNIPVMGINEYTACEKDLIVITVMGINQQEVIEILRDRMIYDYEIIRSYMDLNRVIEY